MAMAPSILNSDQTESKPQVVGESVKMSYFLAGEAPMPINWHLLGERLGGEAGNTWCSGKKRR